MGETNTASKNLTHLRALAKGKKVSLITHWDADGVTSGALIYHIIQDTAKGIHTSAKGDIFLVENKDIQEGSELIICTDIAPSDELPKDKVIYIDHHPSTIMNDVLFSVHDENAQSTSLLIWRSFFPDTHNPYNIFLTLLGYFGDGGLKEDIPSELLTRAHEQLPDLMEEKQSYYNKNETYLEIQRYVSSLNIGKRMYWSGDLPLEMLKNIRHPDLFVKGVHPIADVLNQCRFELRKLYSMKLDMKSLSQLDYAVIESKRNIQGVLCARYMKEKPILVLNRFNGSVIGSLRVPDALDFNAGEFLSQFSSSIPSFLGGGHEKAGGFTFSQEHLDIFITELEQKG